MFDSHPYDGHLRGEKGINAKNIAIIESACLNKGRLTFSTNSRASMSVSSAIMMSLALVWMYMNRCSGNKTSVS